MGSMFGVSADRARTTFMFLPVLDPRSGLSSRMASVAQALVSFVRERLWVVVAALVLSVGASFAQNANEQHLVKTFVLSKSDNDVTRTYFGEVTAAETVAIGFQVAGRMIEFHAPEGEIIPKGATIGRLDPIPFEIALERARLQLQQAERQLGRFQRLAGSTVSDAQREDAETEAQLAEIMLRDAEYAYEQSTLASPFDALVARRSVANFSTVSAGTEVVRLHDMSEMRIDIEVPEVLVQQLGVDPQLAFKARFPGSDEKYSLTFREMNTEVTQVGQTFRVTLAFEAPPDRVLFPGASAVVEATLLGAQIGDVVPAAAIASDPDGQTFVFEVEELDGVLKLVRHNVEVGASTQGDVIVREGLTPGAEIVVGGLSRLSDGMSVRRFTASF